jgi:streptogramin lyase
MPEGTNLGGTSIDPVEQIWMTEWFNNAASEIFRFDPGTNEYCTYKVYKNQSEIGGAHSYHLIYDQGFVWIANWDLDRIIRIDPEAEQSTWWQIPNPASRPVGIALDEDGHLWWTDEGLGAIMQLNPNLNTNNAWTYPLPFGTSPQMLLLMDEEIWYTEFNDDTGSPSGTFGILQPKNAFATPSTLASGTAPVDVVCDQPAGEGTTIPITHSSSSLTWGSLNLTPSFENTAWSIYQLPTTNTKTARPFGIAAGGAYIWMSDQGRQKIIRVEPTPPETRIYLPVVLR